MRITQLELWTHDLQQQQEFYAGLLGLPVVEVASTRLELAAGATKLVFTQAPADWQGYYHFAFNIPNNQFAEGVAWLRERVELIPDASGNDLFRSENWNVENVYFYDPAGNIGELIARHTLDTPSSQPFGPASLQSVSEIGIVADDVPTAIARLQEQTGATIYKDASPEFAPLGDEQGLLIVVKTGRIWFPDTGKPAVYAPVRALLGTNGEIALSW